MPYRTGNVAIGNRRVTEPSSFSLLCWLLARVWAIGCVVGFLFLLIVAVTVTGRIAAVTLLGAGLCPVLLTQAWVDRVRCRLWSGLACGLVTLGLVSVLGVRAPNGGFVPAGTLSASYAGSGISFRHFAPGNLVPEVDQLMACFTVMALVDPLFTWRQSLALKSVTAEIYAELEQNPGFARLPSAMPLVYDEILGAEPATGHTFVYVPPGLDRERPAPVLVFFHGSGGSFKAYLWLLSKMADQLGMVVVAPGFGMGNWRMPETEAAFEGAMQAVGRVVKIDSDNVHVAGLSNGGLAVSQLASVSGRQFRSLVFLSPVFDAERIGSSDFAFQCRSKPTLVLTGRDDDRVPLSYVETSVAAMAGAGAVTSLEVVPEANHFLLFSHRDRASASLVDWYSRHGVSR